MVNLRRYTTQWAEVALRPLLDLIDFPKLNFANKNHLSINKLYKYITVLENIKCRIVFLYQEDASIKNLGYSYFQYIGDSYSLVVRFNKKLFEGEQKFNTPFWRKLIGKHELLHCLSAIFCIPDLKDIEAIEKLKKEYSAKTALEILSEEKIEEIKNKNGGKVMSNYPHDNIFFSDDHFRLSPDKTPLKYHNLYEWLLLPKAKFESYFNDPEKRTIKLLVKENKLQEAYDFAFTKVGEIAKDTNFEEDFLNRRIQEILLSYAI